MKVDDDDRKLLQEKAYEVFHMKHKMDLALAELRALEVEVSKRHGAFGQNFNHDYSEFVSPVADAGGGQESGAKPIALAQRHRGGV